MSDAGAVEIQDLENVERIPIEELKHRVARLKDEAVRFMATTALDAGETFEIYYHFDKDLVMFHLLVEVPKEDPVPSITDLYYCAFLAENEMRDLFGVHVDGLNIDYGGKLLVTDQYEYPPMLRHVGEDRQSVATTEEGA